MNRAGSSRRRVSRPAKVTGGLRWREGLNRCDGFRSELSPCGYASPEVAQERRDAGSRDPGDDLMEAILDTANVSEAWKRVKANKGAAGVDEVSIEDFPDLFRAAWPRLRERLASGSYEPAPTLRVEMEKPDGGKRLLGIPTVLDRVIQQAIARVLGPILDPAFSESSFGFRPGRSARQAVEQVRDVIRSGRRAAVDLDLSKFFDRVDHDILMSRLGRTIRDRRVLRLIGKYLRAGVQVDGRLQRTVEGVPQGGPLSPLLANVVLDDLDKELEKRDHRFARYADDFVILTKSQRAGERVMDSVRRFLESKLKLKVNEGKSRVVMARDLEFLGFAFGTGGKIMWSEKSLDVFKKRIRELTGRSWSVSMEHRLLKLAQYMRGWMGYYAISKTFKEVRRMDHWIRRRLRCCYWKQWKTNRNRARNLIALGVGHRDAMITGVTKLGYWKMSKTPGVNQALSKRYLEEQGLLSLVDLWSRVHYPTTVR